MVNERRDSTADGTGDSARLVIAAQQRDRPTQLLHAATARPPGRQQPPLGRRRVATEHVPGARDLQSMTAPTP